jgi:hypothetical protein
MFLALGGIQIRFFQRSYPDPPKIDRRVNVICNTTKVLRVWLKAQFDDQLIIVTVHIILSYISAGLKLVEAKPCFSKIASLPDKAFIKACAPTLTMEELNVFKESYLEMFFSLK